jgi:hypothetical protein
MDQVGNIVMYAGGIAATVMILANLGKCEAITQGGTHWYGVVPRRCLVGRVIGGVHVTLAVLTFVFFLSLACGLLITYLYQTISSIS